MHADPPDRSARPGGRVSRGRLQLTGTGDAPPVVDMAFDAGTLPAVRAELQARASRAGLGGDRAADVVLAVHELAANAISHGGGAGRVRVWNPAGALLCQVDDRDLAFSEPGFIPDRTVADSLPCEPGHGLWVVAQVADRMQLLSGPRGTRVMITFGIPRE